MKTTSDQNQVIHQLILFLKEKFSAEPTGHDWFHLERVWKNAKLISQTEGGNLFVIELAALLHDIADHKFVENADQEADHRIQKILITLHVNQEIIDQVKEIVKTCSFKGGLKNEMKSLEGLIVQDADRLDAIGAIGIARTFAFGGKFNRELYNPDIKPVKFKSAEEYRNSRSHTINHFYEKLLLLKDGMNTSTGKGMANQRHQFMENYLNQFYQEWNGEL